MEYQTSNTIIKKTPKACTVPQKSYPSPIIPSSTLSSQPKITLMVSTRPPHLTILTNIRRRPQAHRSSHGARMGGRYTYNLHLGFTQLHGVLWQKEHTWEGQSPGKPAPTHVFCLNTSRCLLWCHHKQLCTQNPCLAYTAWCTLENRKNGNGCPPKGHWKTNPTVLEA